MKHSLSDLPDDVRDLILPHMAEDDATLDAIGLALAAKRAEAKSARTSSGMESVWKECEEAYVGIDDANRHEFTDAKWSKPMSMDGPVSTGRVTRGGEHKSSAFVRLTARYVDAGTAKLVEILLPADGKAFSFSEMPVPELIKAKEDNSQVVHSDLGVPLFRNAKPGEMDLATAGYPQQTAPAQQPPQPSAAPAAPPAPGAAPSGSPVPAPEGGAVPPAGAPPGQAPLTVKDLAEEAIEIARKKAKAAETRIYDWMVEGQHAAEVRKVIHDAARIGVGVLKGPVPKSKRGIAISQDADNGINIAIIDRIIPVTEWVDPWNIFPDPACGENICDGDYIFERDWISPKKLRELKKVPGYLSDKIDQVIDEGPDKANLDTDSDTKAKPSALKAKNRFEIWYFYGSLKREDMEAVSMAATGKKGLPGVKDDAGEVYAIVTMVNDSVIRAAINPLDSGEFPYHSVPWQRRTGHWAGIGVAEQVRTPQRICNAALRAALNNAGKSAGSQYVIDQGSIRPADGNWAIVPDKIWYKTGDSTGQDVRQNFMAIEIPNVTAPLMSIYDKAMAMAEESTSIPLITQGQSGSTTPDTFGAAQLQNNNANQLLRSIGYAFDDFITEPVVRQFYEWLLLDPEVPDDEKGEFTINAHGSVALVERAIQDQTIAQMGQMALNPVYGIDPKKWFKLMARSKRLDPEDLCYTDEQQAKIDATPPPSAPAVQVAQIAAQTAATELAAKQQSDQRTAQNEQQIAQAASVLDGQKSQIDAGRVQAEQHRTAVDATIKLHEIQSKRELAMLDYANQHQLGLDAVKAQLARTAMTLDAQKELNAADNAVELQKHFSQQGGGADGHHPSKPPKTLGAAAQPEPLGGMSKIVANNGRAPNGQSFEQ